MAVMVLSAMHLVCFAKRSVMTKMNRLPLLLAGRGPRMSIDNSVSGSDAENKVSGVVCLRNARRFWAQVVQLVMVLWISDIMDGQ